MDNMVTASAVLIPLAVLLLLFIIPIAFWFYGRLKKGTSAYAECIDLDPVIDIEDPVKKKDPLPPPPPSLEKKSSSRGALHGSQRPSSSSAYAVKTDPLEDYPLVMLGHQLLVNTQEDAPSYAYDAASDLLDEEISNSKSPSSYEPPASSHSSWRDDTPHSSHTPSWHSSSSYSSSDSGSSHSHSNHSSSDHSSSSSDYGSSSSSYDSGSSYSDSSSSSSWD